MIIPMRKKFITVLTCIILVPVLLLTCFCIYHQIKLKKERSIITHTIGQFVEVEVTEAMNWAVVGEIVK